MCGQRTQIPFRKDDRPVLLWGKRCSWPGETERLPTALVFLLNVERVAGAKYAEDWFGLGLAVGPADQEGACLLAGGSRWNEELFGEPGPRGLHGEAAGELSLDVGDQLFIHADFQLRKVDSF